jgi:enamine deaminase RidA (YjgF/YER057c/UK114 family)
MRRHLDPEGAPPPLAKYHHVVAVEGATRLAFISGQLGMHADGGVPEDVTSQTEVAFANLDACLVAVGLTRRDIVRLNVYLTDAEYRRSYMEVRDRWVADPPPASTLVIVKALALPACKVEIEAIAAA